MRKTTILIVEDEGIVAEDLARKLEQLGYEVAGTAEHGEGAVALARRLRPDLVLMDIWLQGPMDGIEAAEAILREHDAPVVYLTAHSDPATLDRAKLTGPFGYILKPFQQRDLATQIEMALYRHQADRQLREQRERLRGTLNSIGDAVIATDAAGRVTFVNPAAELLTGWKAQEAEGQHIQSVFRIVNERTGEPLKEPVARVLSEGRAVALANHAAMVTKDGRTVPIEDSAAPIPDAAGQVIGAVLVFHDVTGKRRAEEAQQQGEERLRLALRAAEMGWWHWDLDRNVMTANDRARDIFGLPATAELSLDLFLTFPLPEDRPIIDRQLAEALKSPGDREIEFRIRKRDGSVRWLSAKGRTEHGDGSQHYIMGVVADITDRKLAEVNQALLTGILQVLNRGGDLHPLISETLRLIRGASGFDAAGLRLREGEDYPYFEHNGFSDEFLHKENFLCARGGDGAIVRDAEGRAVLECTCGLVLSGRTDPTMPCFTEGGSFWTNVARELLALPPQSDPRVNPRNYCIHTAYQSVGLFPVRAAQEIIGLLQLNDRREGQFTPEVIAFYEVLSQNIGFALQRMTAEAALRESEERFRLAKISAERAKAAAEQANRAKDHFLAVLSHELRTPLTPVVMGVSMLQDSPDLDAEVRETLEMVRRNVEMEARLIDDLLDVTRITRGKLELNRSPVELCTVINRAVEVCKPDIDARRLEFGVDLGSAAPYWIDADAARLQQVLWNLLKNAIKFTPHGGRVGIRVRKDEGERPSLIPHPSSFISHPSSFIPHPSSFVLIEVNDSGIGIEPEAMSRVFNAFEQAERSITRQFGGLGLGLAISKALVEMHGGSIEAHSDGRDKGATFRIRLPLITPVRKGEATPPAAPSQRAVRSLHILLVEDHGVTAKIMQMVLTSDGHTVERAGDVATALELASRHRFDLLVSDLGLPDGSGHDLMRELRARGHTFPGIALSGYGQEEDIHRSYQTGFAAHLTKPASREAVVETVASVANANIPSG